jgi:hypothetical protein
MDEKEDSQEMQNMLLRVHHVRNIFKILGCHKRDDTTQKSTGKTKFTSAEGSTTAGSLGGKHTWREVHRGFI